jgi:two-component system, chemotaxis family, sensor kinase CheA
MDDITREFLQGTQSDLVRLEEELSRFGSSPLDEAQAASFSTPLRSIARRAADIGFRQHETIAQAGLLLIDGLSAAGNDPPEKLRSLFKECLLALNESFRTIAETGSESGNDNSALVARIYSILDMPGRAQPEMIGEQPRGDEQRELEAPGAAMTIHDAAALLIQIDPGNLSSCSPLAQGLRQLACEASGKEQVHDLLNEAADQLDSLEGQSQADADRILLDVAARIDQVTRLEEGEEVLAPSAAAPEPESDRILLPADSDLELLGEFVTESREFISEAESALLSLEVDPENMEAVNTVFRAFHTIKGTSGFLGLTALARLAHHAESLLSKVRNREIHFGGAYADLALRSVDTLKGMIEQVSGDVSGRPVYLPPAYQELVDVLQQSQEEAAIDQMDDSGGLTPRIGDILVAARKADRAVVDEIEATKGSEPLGVALVRSKAASLTDVAKALRAQQRISSAERADSSVRVRTARLDRLIDMVGELVIAQSMVAQDATVNAGSHHELTKKISHAGKIVRELQDLSMSMRMVPFRATFQRMARLVRDLARKSGKIINFETSGEDTEIDRNMVDLITDPLIHMVRNAVDHGLEPPEERLHQGKSESATILLKAFHSGGNVVVELEDDGRGLDSHKIRERALEAGLIDSDKALTETDINNLIFSPGFSTAREITDVSGRGVGLDVVRRNIELLRGRIEITSAFGTGCKFSLRLPLTLAITDGMLVKVGTEHYIVPTVSIHLSFRPAASALFTVAGRGDLVMLRGELLPMFRLYRLFDIAGAIEDPTKGLLVVVGDGNRRCALLVDELLGQQQVVAKSLGRGLGKVQAISGGAILGDGRVGLILDTMELVSLARQVGRGFDKNELETAISKQAESAV